MAAPRYPADLQFLQAVQPTILAALSPCPLNQPLPTRVPLSGVEEFEAHQRVSHMAEARDS